MTMTSARLDVIVLFNECCAQETVALAPSDIRENFFEVVGSHMKDELDFGVDIWVVF